MDKPNNPFGPAFLPMLQLTPAQVEELRESFAKAPPGNLVAVPREPSPQVEDLAALVRQLVRSLRKAAPGHVWSKRAMDYLARQGLQGSPLRDDAEPSDAEPSDDELERVKAELKRARKLLVDLYNVHPATRTMISERTGPWIVWGIDLDAEPGLPEAKPAPAPAEQPPGEFTRAELELIHTALVQSVPSANHYPEPVKRHSAALGLVVRALTASEEPEEDMRAMLDRAISAWNDLMELASGEITAADAARIMPLVRIYSQAQYLTGIKDGKASEFRMQAPTPKEAPLMANSSIWRVGLFHSSSDPKQLVRIISQGPETIRLHADRNDFVRWLTPIYGE